MPWVKIVTESEGGKKTNKTSIYRESSSNYTLPAPSATQAQSSPKIKYTLHLETNLSQNTECKKMEKQKLALT